jgi:hypothetical protein
VARKQLVVVHGREIDAAGEAGVGLAAFEHLVDEVKSAVCHLEAAGIRQFVITADHGFLLQDRTCKVRGYGKSRDPGRRYVLAAERRAEDGLLVASLAELGYQGRDGYLLLPEDTSVFDTPVKQEGFVHGGASPQERIIPVLSVTSARARDADLSSYVVEAEPLADAVGFRRIRLRLVHDPQSPALPFGRATPIDLAICVPERPEITVAIAEVSGAGKERRGRLRLPVGTEATEVFFTLHGPIEERVQVQVLHPDGVEQVAPCLVEGWFQVDSLPGTPELVSPEPAAASQEWLEVLPDDGIRAVFRHLNEHGVVTEAEAVRMLGSPRRFRRFSGTFEELRNLTPLRVRIEVTPTGKRYVREGGGD